VAGARHRRRIAWYRRRRRSPAASRRTRSVTWTGLPLPSQGRARCRTFGRAPAFRPAFARAPPQPAFRFGNAIASWPPRFTFVTVILEKGILASDDECNP
jgi:hypothetical protein